MIYYSIPWSRTKNIGGYYNSFMDLLDNGDWGCFVDGDACFTTTYFGNQLHDITEKYPECGLFTAMTNRVKNKWQVLPGIDHSNNDINYHRRIGSELYEVKYDLIRDVSDVDRITAMSGVLILIKRDLWAELGGFKHGMLGVDNDMMWKAQDKHKKIYLMEGVYVYHWYRDGNTEDTAHLK